MEKFEKIDWKNKNLWLCVSACLVVLLLVLVLGKNSKQADQMITEIPEESAEFPVEEIKKVSTRRKPTPPVVKETLTTSNKLSYADALEKYKDSRIQFDAGCNAVPYFTTYKNATEVMLDNRSPANQYFFLKSAFTIPAYDFKIITLSSTELPRTFLVDCGQKENVASILLQQ